MVVRPSRPHRFWLLLSLALLFSPVLSRAERVEDLPKPTNYVSDFAHVLSPETTQQLDLLCNRLSHSAANAQIQVVTIKTLDGDDIDDFTVRLEEKWKIGKKGSDRGVLMLFAIQDHKRRIEVGYGLEGILPDGKVGDIGRAMVPQLRAQNYDGAVTTGVARIVGVIAADAHVSADQLTAGQSLPQREQQPMPRRHVSAAGVIFKIIIIVLVLAFLGIRGLFGFGLGMFLGGGGGGWGGGGGGWGGGSDGGGGGGYDGSGGGESGGGGASGDW